MDDTIYIPAMLIAMGAMCLDLKAQKVPNRYLAVCLFAVAGIRLRVTGIRWGPAAEALIGGLLPGVTLGWLFLFRMIGAGDIKLLMVIGFLLGPQFSLLCIWRTLLFGAVLSAGILAANGNAGARMRYLSDYVQRSLITHRREPYRVMNGWDYTSDLHMTVPVLLAVLSLQLCGVW